MANSFAKNPELEFLLERMNGYLRVAEAAQPTPPPSVYPLILLVGAPRSGTTLFMQWLHATGLIAVPTNLMSRFFAAPAFGVMLQRLLTDPRYRYRDELDLPPDSTTQFGSDLGKTHGLLGHNSFFYFWRQFIPLIDSSPLPPEDYSRVDGPGLKRAVARLSNELSMPLAMKAYLVQYNLRLLENILDRVLFVHLSRDPLDTMRSLLQVRQTMFGEEGTWWGCRPPGSEKLRDQDPAVQVAGQVALTVHSIRLELEMIPKAKQLAVSYEQLCDGPATVWSGLKQKIAALCTDERAAHSIGNSDYVGPASFRRSKPLSPADARLEKAWLIAKGFC